MKWFLRSSTAIALGSTMVVTLIFVTCAALGWPFPEIEEECFENYRVESFCYCERPRGDAPGDVWIAQPANTASNLAFVVVGMAIALDTDRRRTMPSTNHNNINLMGQHWGIPTLLACLMGMMGPGSSFLHASLTEVGRRLDQLFMMWIGAFIWCYAVVRKFRTTCCTTTSTSTTTIGCQFLVGRFFRLWIVLALFDACIVGLVGHLKVKQRIHDIIITSTMVLEIWNRCASSRKQQQQQQQHETTAQVWFLVAGISCSLTGSVLWFPSQSGGPWCHPNSWFQGHALFHVCAASALGLIYLYTRSEHEMMTRYDDEGADEARITDKNNMVKEEEEEDKGSDDRSSTVPFELEASSSDLLDHSSMNTLLAC